MSGNTIHVCPICHEVADYSDDHGWSVYCTHEPYESIEPVEVSGTIEDGRLVFPLPDPEEWKRTLGAEMVAKQEERDRKRREWLALSCEQRVAIREERRAKTPPFALLMEETMRDAFGLHMLDLLGHSKTITVPCPRCHDAGCENATTKLNPRYVPRGFWSGSYTVRVEGGSNS